MAAEALLSRVRESGGLGLLRVAPALGDSSDSQIDPGESQPDLGSDDFDLGGREPDLGSPFPDLGTLPADLGTPMPCLNSSSLITAASESDIGTVLAHLGSPRSELGGPQPAPSRPKRNLGKTVLGLGSSLSHLGSLQSDLGRSGSDLGSHGVDLGRPVSDLGSGLLHLGSSLGDLGRPISDLGSGPLHLGSDQGGLGTLPAGLGGSLDGPTRSRMPEPGPGAAKPASKKRKAPEPTVLSVGDRYQLRLVNKSFPVLFEGKSLEVRFEDIVNGGKKEMIYPAFPSSEQDVRVGMASSISAGPNARIKHVDDDVFVIYHHKEAQIQGKSAIIPLDFYQAVVDQFIQAPGVNARVAMCAAQCCKKLKISSE